MRRLLILVISGALITLGAACGGDDGGGERLTQEEFEEQGNAICESHNADMEAAFTEQFGEAEQEPSADEVEAFIDDEIVPLIEDQISELRDLNPPEDIEGDFESLLDDAEEALEEAADTPGEEVLAEDAPDPFEDVNARSEELGLTACAQ